MNKSNKEGKKVRVGYIKEYDWDGKSHRHIWKYNTSKAERICESPIGYGGCGKIDWLWRMWEN